MVVLRSPSRVDSRQLGAQEATRSSPRQSPAVDGDGCRGELTGDLLNTKLTSAKEEEALEGDLSAKIWRDHAGSDGIDLG